MACYLVAWREEPVTFFIRKIGIAFDYVVRVDRLSVIGSLLRYSGKCKLFL